MEFELDAMSDAQRPDESQPDGSQLDGDGSQLDGSQPDGSQPDESQPDGSQPDGSLPSGGLSKRTATMRERWEGMIGAWPGYSRANRMHRDRAEAVCAPPSGAQKKLAEAVPADFIPGDPTCAVFRKPGSDYWNIRCSYRAGADIWRTVAAKAGVLLADGISFKAEEVKPGGEQVYRYRIQI